MTTPARMRAKFPQTFGDVLEFPDAVLQEALDEAICINDQACWGDKYELGILYHAAALALLDPLGKSNNVKRAKAKNVEVEFDRSQEAQTFMARYRQLARLTGKTGILGISC